MRKYFLVLVGVCSLCVGVSTCSGQSRWKFRSDNYGGIVTGQLIARGEMQTVNGLYKGPWFLGLGGGLDYYRFRSVPLFLSVTRDLPGSGSRGGPYVFLDGGVNLPWYTRELTPYQQTQVSSSQFHAGPWGSTGLGYRWRISARSDKAVLFSVGYSMKQLKETAVGEPACLNCQVRISPQTYYYEYLNHTIVFQVGVRF